MTQSSTEQLGDRLAGYAAGLRQAGAIRSDAVEAAFAAVERHQFLPRFRWRADEYRLDANGQPPADVLDIVYANTSLLTHTGGDGEPPSSSSAPSLMAKMLEALDLRPGLRTLEIGTGTGYNTALIAHITHAPVVSVEAGGQAAAQAATAIRSLGLDGQVQVVHGDGYEGYRDGGPYDRIIVTCGIAGIPPRWLDQLTPDGLIVAPVAHAGVHPILGARIDHTTGAVHGQALLWADFMPAVGHLRPGHLLAHDPAEDIPAAHARHIPAIGPTLDLVRYHDLWTSLGARDPRITRAYPDPAVFDLVLGVCALVDPTAGAAWIHHNGAITVVGTAEIGDQLAALIHQWDSTGRPGVTDWAISWHHADTGAADLLLPHHWNHSIPPCPPWADHTKSEDSGAASGSACGGPAAAVGS